MAFLKIRADLADKKFTVNTDALSDQDEVESVDFKVEMLVTVAVDFEGGIQWTFHIVEYALNVLG